MSFGKITKGFVTRVLYNMGWKMPHGMGNYDGMMCVQAAVRRAETNRRDEFNDAPDCISSYIRGFGIAMNDAKWGSQTGRADGMRRFAVAELGTRTMDNADFQFQKLCKERATFDLLPQMLSALIANGRGDTTKYREILEELLREPKPRIEKLNEFIRTLNGLSMEDRFVRHLLQGDISPYLFVELVQRIGDPKCRDEFMAAVCNFAADILIDMETPGSEYMDLVDQFEARELPAPDNLPQRIKTT